MTIVLAPEVEDALRHDGPVVALESTIISHGLPRPDNLAVARRVEQAVRSAGAVPATVAIVAGVVRIGLDDDALDLVANADDVAKISVRDLATVVARGEMARRRWRRRRTSPTAAGIRLFATGGLGGVHRGAATTFDESADLVTLGRTGITVVCAGVKSILDVGATLERLETLGVAVLGMGTDRFPGFYLRDSGFAVDARVDSPQEVADIMTARAELGTDATALVVANPLPAADEMDRDRHDDLVRTGLAAAADEGVRGKDVTPFLLEWFHRESGGESLRANVAIILRNADLAARIAVAATT